MGIPAERVHARVEALHEFNPMLGFRGCRLGIVYPEITEMQARAIFEAACDVAATGKKVRPEVMIPLVGAKAELDDQAAIVRRVAADVFREKGRKVPFHVGTMIEVPRGAVTAGAIAGTAEFFSFGTNDLTQTTFGLSRDDTGPVLATYLEGYDTETVAQLHSRGWVKVQPAEDARARVMLRSEAMGRLGLDPLPDAPDGPAPFDGLPPAT
jgi:pyruvate,orthophosphate dikinase